MEFEVNGVKLRSGKLSALDQFHVFRKLAPVFGASASLVDALRPGADGFDGVSMDKVKPLIEAIAELPEADCNYVLDKCLSVVRREDQTAVGVASAAIWSSPARRMMFDDLESAMTMIQIAVNVIQDNIGNFSTALPSTSTEAGRQGRVSTR